MICPKCGTEVKDNIKYCTSCGYSFNMEKVFANHENLELQVLIKFGIIALFVGIIFLFLKV